MSSSGEETLIKEMKRTRKRKTTPTITSKKKNKKPSTPQSTTIPSLPDDLVLSIVARVPRLYYPTLSLVSKSFRSLVSSPELYKVRSLLGTTETCLYVFFRCLTGQRWFTLCRKPDNQTLTDEEKKTKSGYALASLPMPNSPNAECSSLVAVGSEIFNIGVSQSLWEASSSSFFILDCRSHTWREAPSLPVALFGVSVGVIDGNIYATGLCRDDVGSPMKNSISLFDPETQTWDPQPIPCCGDTDTVGIFDCQTASIDGKLHVVTHRNMVAYNFKEARWDISHQSIYNHVDSDSYCQIDNVLYSAFTGECRWYDTEAGTWRLLQGLVPLPDFPRASACSSVCACCVRLANFGGKLAVTWETRPYTWSYASHVKFIWCAVIALERRSTSCEIWGKVEWFDHLLTIINGCDRLVRVLAATV